MPNPIVYNIIISWGKTVINRAVKIFTWSCNPRSV